jgi:hypothetical protein
MTNAVLCVPQKRLEHGVDVMREVGHGKVGVCFGQPVSEKDERRATLNIKKVAVF